MLLNTTKITGLKKIRDILRTTTPAPAVVTAKRDSVRHHDVVVFSLTVILSVETESEEALPGEAKVDLRAGVEELSEVLWGGLR